jgi:enoyl-CoA hydratase/carnithine racemase
MATSPVHLHRDGRVATLTIDRPPLNILDIPTIDRLGEAVAELATLSCW